MKKILVSPSLLAADFSRLGEELDRIEAAGADMLHLDVMDGILVPNISFGMPVIASLRKTSRMFFDVHIMIVDPIRYIDALAKAGADGVTFHIEAARDVGAVIDAIKGHGMKAGLTLKPGTPVSDLLPWLPRLDLALVMSVEPGFGGQSFMADMMDKAKTIIVEVNQNMPWVYGLTGSEINIKDVDFVVEGSNPPIAQLGGGGEPSEVDRAVANLIVPHIPNGACLQLGIGGMPNAVGSMIAQSDLKDLGVHTEMYVDGFVDIALAGKITGRRKNLHKGRQVYAFAAGTQKLYDYVNRNPEVMAAPVDYTNDVRVLAQLDNFISINNAIDLDLFGQVNAESAGLRQISGTGGQLDFVMGAYLSNGGKSFICLSSTVTGKDGTVKSRIVPTLTQGSIATDPRSCVQYLVTEYGMVNLKGLSTWERAAGIISIAHPDFREELIASAEKMGIWRRSSKR